MTKIICGFQGVGKTYLCHKSRMTKNYWEPNPRDYDRRNNPWKYYGDIIRMYDSDEYKYLLLPSDEHMLDTLTSCDISYTCVIPYPTHRDDYFKRFTGFRRDLMTLYHNYNDYITVCEHSKSLKTIYIYSDQYLSDVVDCFGEINKEG